jgi:hypothetical protein
MVVARGSFAGWRHVAGTQRPGKVKQRPSQYEADADDGERYSEQGQGGQRCGTELPR